MCMAVCPAEAISRGETPHGDPVVSVDPEKCTGCNQCGMVCPEFAIWSEKIETGDDDENEG